MLKAALPVSSQASPDAARAGAAFALPLLLAFLAARTLLLALAQGIGALVLLALDDPAPWRSAAAWWSVYGTIADLGCLGLLWLAPRSEGKRLRDLLLMARPSGWRDVFAGLGWFALAFPLAAMAGSVLAAWLVFGSLEPPPYEGQLTERSLPRWAALYSLLIWWPIWAATEELTYQGFLLPRLRASVRPAGAAVAMLAFFWALQHSFFPFVLEWKYVAYRFLAFAPVVLALIAIYTRSRKLAPVILAHALMDFAAAYWTLR